MGEFGDKVEGEVKDTGGKVTGDKKMEWEGKGQKAKGDLEGAGRKMREGEPVEGEPIEGDKNL
ncbi:MAG: CsbD family protein [Chloroflexota bacterium]|nr:MAG: CsbD family protein [Chloroflexota bacterium]TMD86121.1 MAG: CsbD family protein [Chloroflexota bacterium]